MHKVSLARSVEETVFETLVGNLIGELKKLSDPSGKQHASAHATEIEKKRALLVNILLSGVDSLDETQIQIVTYSSRIHLPYFRTVRPDF